MKFNPHNLLKTKRNSLNNQFPSYWINSEICGKIQSKNWFPPEVKTGWKINFQSKPFPWINYLVNQSKHNSMTKSRLPSNKLSIAKENLSQVKSTSSRQLVTLSKNHKNLNVSLPSWSLTKKIEEQSQHQHSSVFLCKQVNLKIKKEGLFSQQHHFKWPKKLINPLTHNFSKNTKFGTGTLLKENGSKLETWKSQKTEKNLSMKSYQNPKNKWSVPLKD